jgi:2-oxo-4-hydroxy-4-carboxy-5-ureidoimidazoline decarboxylase
MMPISTGRRDFLRAGLAGAAFATLPLGAATAQPAKLTLDDVNRMTLDAFVAAFGDVIEFTPAAAKSAYARRPFATVTALHEALIDGLRLLPPAEQHAFFKRLSDIGENAVPFTAASTAEQSKSGISSLDAAALARLHELNKVYRAKFDMSYTICVRRNTMPMIFTELQRRLNNAKDVELAAAVQEEFLITRLRIGEQVSGPGAPKIYGDVTAHVLNAMVGKPANGVSVALYEVSDDRSRKVGEAVTNADGRADVLKDQPVPIGRYELRFAIGDYFRKNTMPPVEPFFDVVPMRLFLDKPEESHHVPMIATPFNYSTHG